MTTPPGTSGSLVFTFRDEVFKSSILNPEGTTIYSLWSKHRAFRSDITYISTAERAVANIKWGDGVFSSELTVTILSTKTGRPIHRLQPRPHRKVNGTIVAEFIDGNGSILYWRNQECFDASNDVLVATRMSRKERGSDITKWVTSMPILLSSLLKGLSFFWAN
ncbi:hypothetical protein M407DRAFT_27119 [Tulasnella calospora MUT 4182]|uniref:Uncharacterized protein n=1 Tax=Tulasnella calospora MUT 4182 TaxID=1051891 RepID=A0A0C3KPY0_9AGAM|nr:hypothetical protein M407DRAFT_27119 [Tulasnella calospora MUT 4182]